MRTTTISLDNLEQYMRLEREYQRLAVGMKHYVAHAKVQAEMLEDISATAKVLYDFKDTPWWNSLSVEQRKEIQTHGHWTKRLTR